MLQIQLRRMLVLCFELILEGQTHVDELWYQHSAELPCPGTNPEDACHQGHVAENPPWSGAGSFTFMARLNVLILGLRGREAEGWRHRTKVHEVGLLLLLLQKVIHLTAIAALSRHKGHRIPEVLCWRFDGVHGVPGTWRSRQVSEILEGSRLPAVCCFAWQRVPIAIILHCGSSRLRAVPLQLRRRRHLLEQCDCLFLRGSFGILPVGKPSEDVKVQHTPEGEGHHRAVFLFLDVDEDCHTTQRQSVRDVGQRSQHLGDLGVFPVKAPEVRGRVAHQRPDCHQKLHHALLESRKAQIHSGNDLCRAHEGQDTRQSGKGSFHL
mmetsp:Transcript_3217/g.7457  ORF Transcript_3217/g.7457 Transcript_3217/m.7457 type:complete len:323 (+) Transcript_3217:1007-1975(+)